MAGEWIKVECSTPEKPEVLRMARILAIEPTHVFGCLIRVWCWFDRNTVDGSVDGVVSTDVDAIAQHTGFSSAMREVGWLKFNDEKQEISLPKFSRHNGETAKKRVLKNERQARWRASTSTSTAASTQASTREEKRREEKPTPAMEEVEIPNPGLFDIFWSAYPRKTAKQDAFKAFDKLKLANGDFERVLGALEVVKKTPQWVKEGGKFIPYAATWLNGRRFEDEVSPAVEKPWTP